ncbi:helix-turn-helix domain-containing protein [Oceanomicrobium pacificus]|uniref:HTH DNA binding domain-containing protein n=1 Tax=Oceanomicrobium pacificus TaxID=2692916 RepID=A0A6B0TV29_9RHOB|nr:helix-turn-helix domain-containing protein [Oceanomicrobium pacificus]MXU66679.1 hypothetical protein [Oceanomicrobium pacificus]
MEDALAQEDLSDPALWARAEAAWPRELAGAAAGLARLDERAGADPGFVARLAEREVADLTWAEGAPVGLEQLTMWRHGHVGQGGGLMRAAWAARRLCGPVALNADLGTAEGLRSFLGLASPERIDPVLLPTIARATGAAWAEEAAGWCEDMERLRGLHPVTRALAAYTLWHWRELSDPGDMVEAAVVAARIGAADAPALRFLPLLSGNRLALRHLGQGAEARLGRWLAAATAATGHGLRELARLGEWQSRAAAQAARMQGKLPKALVPLFLRHGLVTANLVQDEAGVTQQAANRTLLRWAEAGLITEISGQDRYRFWRVQA